MIGGSGTSRIMFQSTLPFPIPASDSAFLPPPQLLQVLPKLELMDHMGLHKASSNSWTISSSTKLYLSVITFTLVVHLEEGTPSPSLWRRHSLQKQHHPVETIATK
ncbi:hypothetical protein MLD38_006759 [Melastoma candidum]|uniref:Uncharacterized protein n=1 Tax=Melastoma candidum TaxID=119954 RepID=A0ACB9RSN7_9MYRT|nr:hypothetical protein MLD38_006759 [Melastoma candidum]